MLCLFKPKRMEHNLVAFIEQITVLCCVAFLSACTSVQIPSYVLELNGEPFTRCEITNDQKVIGTFPVPSMINFGSEVGKVEAKCTINDKTVVSKIQTANAQCQDQLVVKGTCPKPISKVEPVMVIIRQSK